VKRRDFLAVTASAATLATRRWPAWRFEPTPWTFTPLVRPFDLARVRLLPGPVLDTILVNRRFLMAQDPDPLLHLSRLPAGLPSNAVPLGGWEAPVNELRGHYTGHYLSSLALMSASLADAELKARGDAMVAELAKCQQALGNGYLSAFPEEFF